MFKLFYRFGPCTCGACSETFFFNNFLTSFQIEELLFAEAVTFWENGERND